MNKEYKTQLLEVLGTQPEYVSNIKIKRHLDADKEILSFIRQYPVWKLALISYAMEKLLEAKDTFELVESCNEPNGGNLAFERREESISLNKTHFCYLNGSLLIKHIKTGTPFVIFFECYHTSAFGTFEVGVIINKGSEQVVEQFFADVDDHIDKHNFYRNAAITPDGEFIDIKSYTWDDLIVEDEIKQELKQNIVKLIENQKLYTKFKIQTKRGILISGSPGVGKTLTGKIIANQVKASFLWVTPKFLTRVEDIGALFEFAREISPTILYFEDVDLYALDREEEGNRSAILGEILNQMDGIVDNDSVITVMTTNYAHKLEKALKDRPGRFDCHIKFDVPKKKIKIKLYKHLLKDCIVEDLDWDALAAHGPEFSGAHIAEVVNYAKMRAIDANSIKDDKLVITNALIKESTSMVSKYFESIKETIGFVSKREMNSKDYD